MAELPETVDAARLAWTIGVSERHLRRMAEKGIVVRLAEGRYDLATSLRGVLRNAAETGRRQGGSAAAESLRTARSAAIERRLAREDRALIAADEAIEAMRALAISFDQALASLPNRLSADDPLRKKLEAHAMDARIELSAAADLAVANFVVSP